MENMFYSIDFRIKEEIGWWNDTSKECNYQYRFRSNDDIKNDTDKTKTASILTGSYYLYDSWHV